MSVDYSKFVRKKINSYIKQLRYMDDIKETSPYFPLNVYIEAINGCNYRCVKCPQGIGLMTRKKGVMKFETYKKIIDQISDLAVEITFALWGEPTLNKYLPDMVSYSVEKGLYTSIITNGSRMFPELSEKIINAGVNRVVFSLDSSDKSLYEETRVKGVFETTLYNALTFLKLNIEKNAKVWCTASMVEHDNDEMHKQFIDFYSQFPFSQVYTSRYNNMQGSLPGKDGYVKERSRLPQSEWPVCSTPWHKIAVHFDGRVTGCITDYNGFCHLGNIMEEPIIEIWNNEKMRNMRKALLSKDYTSLIKQGLRCDKCNHKWDVSDFNNYAREVESQIVNEIMKKDKYFTVDSEEYKNVFKVLADLKNEKK